MTTMVSSEGAPVTPATAWRTRDIVVTAIIGVAFGVLFVAWNALWNGVDFLVLPVRSLIYGVWLMPAVLAPYLVRKPGAALFAEMVAAGLSAIIGNQWGLDTLLSGFVQGAAAELVFAFALYRVWSLPILGVAAVASAAGAWVHDWAIWYADVDTATMLAVGVAMAVSAIVLTALGSYWLARALRQAGVLEGFPAGR